MAAPSPASGARLVPGARLGRGGRYEVVREIGRGAFGAVFEAHDAKLNVRVALKRVPLSAASAAEAEALGRVVHPNVLRLLDSFADGGAVLLVLELCRRGSLCVGRLSEAAAALRVRDALRGLAALHALHIVHRDIKPQNLLLGDDGRCKVGDLGLAQLQQAADAEAPLPGDIYDGASEGQGSPYYMSPEAATPGARVDTSSDIYSLGATLFALVAGRTPWARYAPLAALWQLAHGGASIAREMPEGEACFSHDVRSFILACMARDPALRPTAETLLTHPLLNSAAVRALELEEARAAKDVDEEEIARASSGRRLQLVVAPLLAPGLMSPQLSSSPVPFERCGNYSSGSGSHSGDGSGGLDVGRALVGSVNVGADGADEDGGGFASSLRAAAAVGDLATRLVATQSRVADEDLLFELPD